MHWTEVKGEHVSGFVWASVKSSVIIIMVQVRRAPQRRGTPRPNRSKPHMIRPVEDITEDEIQLVAENMTDKVYNSVTVSSRTVLFTATCVNSILNDFTDVWGACRQALFEPNEFVVASLGFDIGEKTGH